MYSLSKIQSLGRKQKLKKRNYLCSSTSDHKNQIVVNKFKIIFLVVLTFFPIQSSVDRHLKNRKETFFSLLQIAFHFAKHCNIRKFCFAFFAPLTLLHEYCLLLQVVSQKFLHVSLCTTFFLTGDGIFHKFQIQVEKRVKR